MKLAAYSLVVSILYAVVALAWPQAAGPVLVLFVAAIVVPASVDAFNGRGVGRRPGRRP